MTAEATPYGRVTQRPPAVSEVHVLWITAGLGCDGDSVSITAATQPSIEDVLMGAIPGLPKVHLHNPVLAYEVGDDFMKYWYLAEEGKLEPFVLVVEGSIPNEKIKRTGDYLALDTGGGPIARFWATALAGLVDIGYVKATGHSVKIYLSKTALLPEVEFEWKIPKWSNAIERDRARTYFQAYVAACALYFIEQALKELHAGNTKVWSDFKVPEEAIGCGFHEAVRGVLSHHVVIREGKIANYHPYPPTPWNANPRDVYDTPGPYEDAVQGTPIFEENGPDKFKGIDIMRAVRSFDPCLPCGVHMYLGNGKVLETRHSPMFGLQL